jgi:hypothetical protein
MLIITALLCGIQNLIPNQIMFATHQYILEGMAVPCPYNLSYFFSNWYNYCKSKRLKEYMLKFVDSVNLL